jgi:hypothetical protein
MKTNQLETLDAWHQEAREHKRKIRYHREQLHEVMTRIALYESKLQLLGITLEQGERETYGQSKRTSP